VHLIEGNLPSRVEPIAEGDLHQVGHRLEIAAGIERPQPMLPGLLGAGQHQDPFSSMRSATTNPG
jgi:hypothetical protein